MKFSAALFLTGGLVAGCGDGKKPPVACTALYAYGLTVTVSSGNTAVCDATVTAQDGDYVETLTVQNCTYIGAGERPGNYTVTVSKSGFATQSKSAVVTQDESGCHVVGASLSFEI